MEQIRQTVDQVPVEVHETIERNAKWGDGQVKSITLQDLTDYGTSCGTVGEKEKVFASKAVAALLKTSSKGGFVLAATVGREIFYLAVRWKGNKTAAHKLSAKFSELIDRNGGSLRADEHLVDGWDTYESE